MIRVHNCTDTLLIRAERALPSRNRAKGRVFLFRGVFYDVTFVNWRTGSIDLERAR